MNKNNFPLDFVQCCFLFPKQLPAGTPLPYSALVLSMAKNQSDVENLVKNCLILKQLPAGTPLPCSVLVLNMAKNQSDVENLVKNCLIPKQLPTGTLLRCSVLIFRMAKNQSDVENLVKNCLINTYSMKQPDLYYFETIKMTSQA